MKRFFSFLVVALLFTVTSYAQPDTLFHDDFDGLTTGDYVALEDTTGFWTTWSNSPGGSEDAQVASTQDHTTGSGLSAHVQGTATDLVLKLGNKISGKYAIDFWYYIISGKGGYFNIQHTEEMGNEWAFECYFGNNGTGKLTADGNDLSFTHATDAWVHVNFIVDLDADSCWLAIDNDTIKEWIFSKTSDGSNGIKQLGGVDFYAGAITGQTPEYYLDDVNYITLVQGSIPPISQVSITSITSSNADTTVALNVTNGGDIDMMYDVFAYYPTNTSKSANNNTTNTNKTQIHISPSDISTVKCNKAVTFNRDADLTHLTGNVNNGLGWNSDADGDIAVLFKNTELEQYVGMQLTNIIFIFTDPITNTSAKTWTGRRYISTTPIKEVTSQSFSADTGQNVITLTTPLTITGEDLYIGCSFHSTSGTHPIGMDDGPPTDDANWTHVGPSWSELTTSTFGNFGIIGNLTGTASPTWINLSANQGIITGGNTAPVQVTFDTTGLADNAVYNATIVVRTNDLDTSRDYIEIPVTLTLGTPAGIRGVENVNVMTYPNPAYDFLNVQANEDINKIDIISMNGQVVSSTVANNKNARVNISNLQKGVYIVNIYTSKGVTASKIVIK